MMQQFTLDVGEPTQVSKKFLQGMVDRMAVSFHKYGDIRIAYPHDIDALENIQKRIDKYKETKNTEYLMDAANFAMIEFILPRLEGAFYEATDSSGSPGRVRTDGREAGQAHNLDVGVPR